MRSFVEIFVLARIHPEHGRPFAEIFHSPAFLATDSEGFIPVLVIHSETSSTVKHTVAAEDYKTRAPAKTLTTVRVLRFFDG